MPYKLLPFSIVGNNTHRSGWPYVMSHLRKHHNVHSKILLDDYIERTFLFKNHDRYEIVHRTPWVAICHHPPDIPEWYSNERLQRLDKNRRWQASFENLELVISLGNNLTTWIENNWFKKCITIRHPSSIPKRQWSVENFEKNTTKRLVQVGTWLRNTLAIYHVDASHFLKKTRLIQSGEWAKKIDITCLRKYGRNPKSTYVEEMPYVDNKKYDLLLSENIIFLNLITAVANNTIVECIARNTPIVVNRLAGPVYYLGPDYPLFYRTLEEVPELLTLERILSAHYYLKKMKKEFLSGSRFAGDLITACKIY